MRRIWHYFRNLLKSIFAIGVLAGALLYIIVYPFSDGQLEDLAWAAATLLFVSVMIYVLRRVKLLVWMGVTYASYIIGLVYAINMLFTPNVLEGYRTAVLTMAMFIGHGFAAGGFVELVTILHRLTARGIELVKEKTRLKLEEE